MASIVQFVDSITASPTVRLDLNSTSSNLMVDEKGIDLSPPVLRYAVASTMLQDGETIAGSSYENRVLKLPLKLVYAASTDAAATALQNLGRELNRPTNLIKLQLHGATSPVFFRTFRSSYLLSMLRLLLTENTTITLELPTEYAGYGLLETPVSAVTVSTDPAAGSNGCFVDVTGVKGDVEAPAVIRWPRASVTTGWQTMFATRRRGTPSSAPFLIQAESMTQGTDTTTQANDANFSGAGNNYSRTTFATNATMQTRLSVTTVGTAGVDLRGKYRVLMRYHRTSGTGEINLRLVWRSTTGAAITNSAFVTVGSTAFLTADLGEISIPLGIDPVVGPDGVELAVSNALILEVQAERTSGTASLETDFSVLVPADDQLAIVEWNAADTGASYYSLNAENNAVHLRDSSDRIHSANAPSIAGGLPMLSPGVTNRVYMLRNIDRDTAWFLPVDVTPVSVSYHPRYLSVRPAST